MIAREERRLRRLFRGAIAAAVACGACRETLSGPDADVDASIQVDASVEAADAGTDVRADAKLDASADAPLDPCTPFMDVDAALEQCGFIQTLPCGLPPDAGFEDACNLTNDTCYALCGVVVFRCATAYENCVDGSIAVDGGPVQIDCTTCLGGPGRRPFGLARPRAVGSERQASLGPWFAAAAHLERASILAFARLGRDLRKLGAPRSLSKLAQHCARDELRHTRTMTRLARAHGVEPVRPRVERLAPRRSLEEVALENAVEGCVGETYAALIAAWQASHARDSSITMEMRGIAKDELRHAAFSWAIARWAATRLDFDANARIAEARRIAIAALRRQATHAEDATTVASAGLPSPTAQTILIDELETALWGVSTYAPGTSRPRSTAGTRGARSRGTAG